ncbi:MAG TPA: serine hydrolase [Phototrophicaceae bacterium]|nr:serine hydrolase [Phototrophicaceae bacterium]
MCSDILESLDQHIAADLPMVRSVVAAVDGMIAYERYFVDAAADKRAHIFSCTKSILSMLVGILVKQGKFPDLDTRVVDVLPALKASANASFVPITVRQCLNMTLGHVMDASDYRLQPVSEKSVAWELGQRFRYSDVGPQAISMMIQEITGQTASAFANAALFAPLGVENPQWDASPDGYTVGGWGLWLSPRETLSLGQLALQQGNWRENQLADPQFFTQSTQRQSEGGFPNFDPYGFFWWVSERGGYHTYYAWGFGGQLICVCPGLKLVTVVTSTTQLEMQTAPVQTIYFEYVMKACISIPRFCAR